MEQVFYLFDLFVVVVVVVVVVAFFAVYGSCAQAPLVDSVFAGQLVSIVLCHECHQV